MPNFSSSNWQCCFATARCKIYEMSQDSLALFGHISRRWKLECIQQLMDVRAGYIQLFTFRSQDVRAEHRGRGAYFSTRHRTGESLLHIFNVSFADGAYPPSTAGFQPLLSNSSCNFSAPFLNVLLPGFTRQCTEKPSQPVFRVRTQGESLR